MTALTSPVTDSQKRYMHVFVCVVCDKLGCAERSHAVTCSAACRVWIHRHPQHLDRLKAICAGGDVSIPLVLQAAAVERLLPDRTPEIVAGTLSIADVRGELWRAFWALLVAAAEPAGSAST